LIGLRSSKWDYDKKRAAAPLVSIDKHHAGVLKRFLVLKFKLQVGDNFFQTPRAPVAYNSGMTISALPSPPEGHPSLQQGDSQPNG
jgi:hypothetical protein